METGFFLGIVIALILIAILIALSLRNKLSRKDIKALDRLSQSELSLLTIEVGISWLSMVITISKEKANGLAIGDMIGICDLVEDDSNLTIISSKKLYNLSAKRGEGSLIKITGVEDMEDVLIINGVLI